MATIVITGGHGGIGYECSKTLAKEYHMNLVLVGRSRERMEPVAQELREKYAVKVTVVCMDTSSLESVRSGTAEIERMIDRKEIDSLQGIICNAGVRLSGPLAYSVDGYELTFATNYLGHFLFVEGLKHDVAPNGRIVFTSSGTHDPDTTDGKMMGIAADYDAFALANAGKNNVKPISNGKSYTTSKLCIMLYAYELDRQLRAAGSTVSSIAFDPGSTFGTGFLREMPRPLQWIAKSAGANWLMKRAGITIGDVIFSGQSLAKLAADPAYVDASGKYFQSHDGHLNERNSSVLSYDEKRAKQLTDDSRKLVHI